MKENIYIKITTIPEYSEKGLELYFKKYKDSNKLEDLKQAEVDFYKNAGKNPLFSKIHSLTIGYVVQGQIRITVLRGEEKDILNEFINTCKLPFFESHQICAWNFSFILPFLRIRSAKNKIKANLHKDAEDIGKKAWTITGLDLFDHWKGLGWFSSSLEEVAELTFSLETKFIDGEDVYSNFKAGKLVELDQSSIDEVFTLINVHNGIKKEDFISEFTATVNTLEVPVQEVELTLLQKLNSNKNIYASELAEIKTILNKPKLAKKDKEICFELIKASLSDIDKDFGKVKNQTEIDQIINQLKSELENN
jgi:hypothetical protein